VANDILDAALAITEADITKGADLLAKAVAKTAAAQTLAEKAIERQIQGRRDILEVILRRYESDRVDGSRGTMWGAYNAVTESADWGRAGGRYRGKDKTRRASQKFVSIVEGRADEVKQIALERVMQYVSA
jgi:hypothetical protein